MGVVLFLVLVVLLVLIILLVIVVLVVLCFFLVLVGNPKKKCVCGCPDFLSPCPIPWFDCFCFGCFRWWYPGCLMPLLVLVGNPKEKNVSVVVPIVSSPIPCLNCFCLGCLSCLG